VTKAPLELRNPSDPLAWDRAYQESTTPWDLGGPTPEFLRLLEEEKIFGGKPGFATSGSDAPKVLIPGCGRGYDVLAFAECGFQVVGLDFSAEAIQDARKIQAEREAKLGRSLRVEWGEGDFFHWSMGLENQSRFDFLVEYTFFCAIAPARRADYVKAAHRVLKPSGTLVGLFFPFEKRDGGPPFALDLENVKADFSNLFSGEWREPGASIKPRLGREKLGILHPKHNLFA
jgi:methyl halide transferase